MGRASRRTGLQSRLHLSWTGQHLGAVRRSRRRTCTASENPKSGFEDAPRSIAWAVMLRAVPRRRRWAGVRGRRAAACDRASRARHGGGRPRHRRRRRGVSSCSSASRAASPRSSALGAIEAQTVSSASRTSATRSAATPSLPCRSALPTSSGEVEHPQRDRALAVASEQGARPAASSSEVSWVFVWTPVSPLISGRGPHRSTPCRGLPLWTTQDQAVGDVAPLLLAQSGSRGDSQ